MIPQKLQVEGIKFVLIEKEGKKPFQQEWQKKIIGCYNPELLEHIKNGGNYGVMGGGEKKLLIVDFDNERVQTELCSKLPATFTVKSGGGLLHKYYFSDRCESFKIFDSEMNTLLDVQGEGKQVVGAGSIHPNKNRYIVVDDIDIATITYSELKALIMPYDQKPKKEKALEYEKPTEYTKSDLLDNLKKSVKIEDVLNKIGINTSKNPTQCPFHSSKGGACLGFKDEVAHCFHCEDSWNIFSLVKAYKKCDFKEALLWLVEQFGFQKEYEENSRKYKEYLHSGEKNAKDELKKRFLELISGDKKRISEATEILVDYMKNNNYIYSTRDDIKSEMWIYKEGVYIPQGKSIIKEQMREILGEWFNMYFYNQVISKIEADTFIDATAFFSSKYVDEIPVQNGILNVFSRELKPFNPKKIFFNKLPVKYEPTATCQNIDTFLSNVLKETEDKLVFYELAGSALLKEYRFEIAAMLVGNGRNGKGKSLELLKRLVGAENCSSIPLSSLTPDSFSISELFGKLFNLAGDIGNKDLQDTSMFKSLTGRDIVTAKRKFLNGLTFENYAKFVFACNDLPTVYDTSRGFWDRWLLLEYPYTFISQSEYDKLEDTEKKLYKIRDDDIINKIVTPNELSGLLNEALDGLDRLIKNHKFSATKGSKEVKEVWMRKANSVVSFSFDFVEEDVDRYISKKEFRKKYSEYCKKHNVMSKSDFIIKKALQEMFGAMDERIMVGSSFNWVWSGVKWKN